MRSLTARLVDEVLDRPHLQLYRPGEDDAWVRDHHELRLIRASGPRVVDITRPGATRVIMPERKEDFYEVELARPYLRHVFRAQRAKGGMGSKRIPWRHDSLPLLDKLPPRLYKARPTQGSWTYVDLTSAYPSLYGPLTLDMTYRPERGTLALGRFEWLDFAETAAWKPAHRAIGGILRSRKMTVIERGGRSVTRDTIGWSTFLCPDLWGVIMDSLHAVAAEAERRGAVLWDTDGGIMPTEAAAGFSRWCADTWQLRTHDRLVGDTIVWGLKHWSVGNVTTLQPTKRQLREERYLDEPSLACRRTLIRVREKRLSLQGLTS